MKRLTGVALCVCLVAFTHAEVATVAPLADEVVRRSIAYHDPEGVWGRGEIRMRVRTTFSDELAQTRGSKTRELELVLAPSAGRFRYSTTSGDDAVSVSIDADSKVVTLNGSTEISDDDRTRLRLQPAEFYRNYYEYLYGMPMKLRDPGAHIDPDVNQTTFRGRPALALRVTYDPAAGDPTWFFLFDPTTFEIIGYRFNRDEAGEVGEIIVLGGEVAVPGKSLRLPRSQSWYVNADDRFLATDEILAIEADAGR